MKQSTARNNTNIILKTMICLSVSISVASILYAKPVSYKMPSAIDRSTRYFFFLHNYYVEKHGPEGACKYYGPETAEKIKQEI